MNDWLRHALYQIQADVKRSSDTHLIKVDLPAAKHISLYLKDESTHPTGSLKHRLARSLFLYGLCNGYINEGTTIVESSSGNTAVSEAYFAQLLGLPFIAVVPNGTSQQKIDNISFYNGECRFVEPQDIYSEAIRIAESLDGHYMDQFTFAERATDWRGNNNIAESLFRQLSHERFPEPSWVVVGAGTGGTSATIGRFIRYQKLATKLCVADPENSVYFDYYKSGDASLTINQRSRIEGIGRPRVEPSFVRSVIDRMIQVPDAAAIAMIRMLETVMDRRCGASTGTNLWAVLQLIKEMKAAGQRGSIVTLICDGGERYGGTYYNDAWLKAQCIDPSAYAHAAKQLISCD